MKTRVTNSRTHKKQPQTWRRRQCVNCKGIFTSYERPDSSDLIINSKGKKSSFNIGKLILSIARASQHNKHQAEYDSFQLASTIEISLISKSKKTRSGSSMIISRAEIINTTYQTLRRYDELTGMQYAMQHGLITSVRRRGRPSTIATSDESGAAPD